MQKKGGRPRHLKISWGFSQGKFDWILFGQSPGGGDWSGFFWEKNTPTPPVGRGTVETTGYALAPVDDLYNFARGVFPPVVLLAVFYVGVLLAATAAVLWRSPAETAGDGAGSSQPLVLFKVLVDYLQIGGPLSHFMVNFDGGGGCDHVGDDDFGIAIIVVENIGSVVAVVVAVVFAVGGMFFFGFASCRTWES